ncbi:MAG: hypothetical protein HC911_04530 [Chloroflexaceae bacterium]|nr:hypothetical protein [Chloroflexaceae bacterium]
MKHKFELLTAFPFIAFLISGSFALILLIWRLYADVPLLVISADDLARAILGWDVTQGKLIPSDVWLPLQFWLQAALTPFGATILWNALVVNLAASGITLLTMLLFGREIGLRLSGSIFLILLLVSLPWFIWLSVSGMSEPLFFLGIVLSFYGTIKWYRQKQVWGLWLAAIGLLIASLVRFDAWAYAIVFAFSILWCRVHLKATYPPHAYIIAALPLGVIALWLTYSYIKYQDPFVFAKITRGYYLALHPDPAQRLSLLDRVIAQPRDLIQFASLTLILAPIGVWLQRHMAGVWILVTMWIAGLFLLMRSTINYTITMNNPERLVIILVILMAPWAALTLQALWQKPFAKPFVIGCLLFVVVTRSLVLPHPPNIWSVAPDSIPIRQHLIELRQAQILLPDDRIMIEVVFWDFVLLHAMTESPGAVIYDRAPALIVSPEGVRVLDDVNNPSIFVESLDVLDRQLQAQNVRVLIVADEMAKAKLRNIAKQTFSTDKFTVFVRSGTIE